MSTMRRRAGLPLRAGRSLLASIPGSLGEHGLLAVAGAVTALFVLGLGAATAASVHQRDAALGSAAAAARRLGPGGVDYEIEQNLIKLQLGEVEQFQARVDTGTATVSGLLSVLESELAGVTEPAAAHADAVAIVQELTVYIGLEVSAQSDGRTGLPVGAAYVREASRYLTANLLPNAEKIRTADQNALAASDSTAAAFPSWLLCADAAAVCWLGAGSVLLARFTRRTLNPGVLGALAAVLALGVWSLSAILLAGDRLDGRAAPAAAAATGLSRVRFDAANAEIDDQLTLSDNGEDCVFTTGTARTTGDPTADPYADAYTVDCMYEHAAEAELDPAHGILARDLESVVAVMGHTRGQAAADELRAQVSRAVSAWYGQEQKLPTLQNLDVDVMGKLHAHLVPRFDAGFDQDLVPYTEPTSQSAAQTTASADAIYGLVDREMEPQWKAYADASSDASSMLGGLFLGAVLLGSLGAAVTAAGIGARVAQYWARGQQDLSRYTSPPLARLRGER